MICYVRAFSVVKRLPMPKTQRRADRDQFWRETFAAWKSSGHTVTAFCAARGLAEATFYVKRPALAQQVPTHPTPPAGPTFAAVRVIPYPTVVVIVPGRVTATELAMILGGIDFGSAHRRPRYEHPRVG
jgi:hypothetical protein